MPLPPPPLLLFLSLLSLSSSSSASSASSSSSSSSSSMPPSFEPGKNHFFLVVRGGNVGNGVQYGNGKRVSEVKESVLGI